jgi:hypothetical protein
MAPMSWPTIGVIVLVGWLAIAICILVVVFIRRVRAEGRAKKLLEGFAGAWGFGGKLPHVPPPEWVDRDEAKSPDD